MSNETLMAYVDGELDSAARAEVEAAMRADAEIERRIAQLGGLREQLKAAYEPELAEAVPDRLLAVLRAGSARPVPIQDRARIASRDRWPVRRRWRIPASLAAGVLLAVCATLFAWQRAQSVLIQHRGGALVAGGALARGLSDRVAGDAGTDRVRIGVSFLARSGEYCRTFSVMGDEASVGIACRTPTHWEIRTLEQTRALEPSGGPGSFRTAESSLPPGIAAAVQAQIAGDPLDREGEIRARQSGWRTPGG